MNQIDKAGVFYWNDNWHNADLLPKPFDEQNLKLDNYTNTQFHLFFSKIISW